MDCFDIYVAMKMAYPFKLNDFSVTSITSNQNSIHKISEQLFLNVS